MYNKISAFLLYILITVLVLSLYVDRHAALERYEQKLVDWLSKMSGSKNPGTELVIVAIDDKSFNQVGFWPWNYSRLNQLLYHLAEAHPRAIVFQTPLPQVARADSAAKVFANNLSAAGNVVLPVELVLTDIPAAGDQVPPEVLKSSYFTYDSFHKLRANPPLWAVQMQYPPVEFARAAADIGFVLNDYDPDQKLRREPLVIGYSENYYPALAVQAVKFYMGINTEAIKLNPGTDISIGRVEVPVDRKSRYLINYYGPRQTFRYVSAADVISGSYNPAELAGKIALVGLTATGTRYSVSTPLEEDLPEVEKTATVAANIISGKFIRTDRGNFLGFLWIIGIGVFSAFLLPRVTLIYRFMLLLALMFALVNVNFFLFRSMGIISKTFYPTLEILLFLLVSPAIKPQKELVTRKKSRLAEKLSGLFKFRIVRLGAEAPRRWEPARSTRYSEQEESLTASVDMTESQVPIEPEEEEAPPEEPKKKTTSTDLPIPVDIHVKQFGRYQVLEPIGRGAMGTVYKGLDPAIDRLVALKTIRLDFAANPEELEEMKERLLREARAAGKISHPNIVTIYDAGQEEGYQYIAMEYLEGTTLERYIRKKTEINFKIMAQILIQVCDALDYAHSHGIVHRDIKPANIMVLDNFQVKVMDFGIARFGQANLTQTGMAMGTPNYMPPEVLKGKIADKRSDIFSLGIMTYELLTGKRPFRGPTISSLIYSILNDNPPPPSQMNNRAPNIFDRICEKCLKKDPEERYQTAAEVSAQLKQFVAAFVGVKSASKVTAQE